MPLNGQQFLISDGRLGGLADYPGAATLGDGRVVFAYSESLTEVIRIWDPKTDTIDTIDEFSGNEPRGIVALAGGGFVVAGVEENASTGVHTSVGARVYDDQGALLSADPILVYDGECDRATVHATKTGFFVTFISDEGVLDDDLYGRFYTADGTPQGAAFLIDDRGVDDAPGDATLLANGNLLLAWNHQDPVTFVYSSRGQIFAPDGTPQGAAFELASPAGPGEDYVQVAPTADGGFIQVTYQQTGPKPDYQQLYHFLMTRFDADGKTVGTPVVLPSDFGTAPYTAPTFAAGQHQAMDVAVFDNGQVVLAWAVNTASDGTDVRYGVYGLDGSVIVPATTVNTPVDDDQMHVNLTTIDGDTVLLTFMDGRNVVLSHQASIQGILIDAEPTAAGPTGGADTLSGTSGADTIAGLGGNDSIDGLGGDDRLSGDNGNDTLSGGAGNDTITGGHGRDKAFLGAGRDLFVDDAQKGAHGSDTVHGGGGSDTVKGGGGNDVIHGDAGNDKLLGGAENDSLYGDDGNDTLNGGAGNDLVVGGKGRDRVFLGSGDDVFHDDGEGGRQGRDTVHGGNGADTIKGGLGNDMFYGENGNDRLSGGGGADVLAGGRGRDVMNGGAGSDTFVFGAGWGHDRVVGFTDDVDQLKLSSGLWTGTMSAAEVIAAYAHSEVNSVVFIFDGGEVLTVTGISDPTLLANDLILA